MIRPSRLQDAVLEGPPNLSRYAKWITGRFSY